MGLSQSIHLSNDPGPDSSHIRHELPQPLLVELPRCYLWLRVQSAERLMVKLRLQFWQFILSDSEHVVVLITEIRGYGPAFRRVYLVVMNGHHTCPEQVLEDLLCLLTELCQQAIRSSVHLILISAHMPLLVIILATEACHVGYEISYTPLHSYLSFKL